MSEFRPTKRTVGAAVLVLLAFVVFFGETSRTIENGVVTSEHEYNYGALILGVIAIILVAGEAYRLLRGDRSAASGPLAMHAAVFVAIAGLGLYHVLNGADLV
jgi:phosphate/sulfate permease